MIGKRTTSSEAKKEEDQENVEVSLNRTELSSSNNLHLYIYKALLELDLSSHAQYKQCFLVCQECEFEDDPKKFQDSTKPYFRNR